MKSRLAVTMTLMLGLVLSSAGAGLAVSGQSGSDNAAGAQYTENRSAAPETQQVLGEVGSVTAPPSSGAAPTAEATPSQPVQQQEVTSEGELPFTGFASGGVLLLGLAMLAGGLVMRRRLSDQS